MAFTSPRSSRIVPQSGDRKSTRLNSSHITISYAVFCLNHPAPTDIYTLSLHDALPICRRDWALAAPNPTNRPIRQMMASRSMQRVLTGDPTKLMRLLVRIKADGVHIPAFIADSSAIRRSEEHTSELQSHHDLVCRLLLESSRPHRHLHSFPTRRSSDLPPRLGIGRA